MTLANNWHGIATSRPAPSRATPLLAPARRVPLKSVPWSGTLPHWIPVRHDREFSGCVVARFFIRDRRSRHIPFDLVTRLFRKLQMLDDAATDADLRVPPSNHFENLSGSLSAYHSLRVNDRWRLIFRWDGSHGEAMHVYLDDHSYR